MVNATPAGMVEFEGKFYQPAERDAILAARAAKASADAAAALQPGEVYDHKGRLVAGWRPSDLVPAEYLADPEAYEPSVGNELVTEGQLVGTLDLIGTGGGGGDDPLAVKLTGDQTIDGVKTFSSAPVVPDDSFSQSKVTNLTTDLAAKADDNAVVKLTGDQTVDGVKTFSSAPVVPDGSFTQAKVTNLEADLASKLGAADIAGKADDNAVVKLTGDQTIAGAKTFSTAPVVPDGSFAQAKVTNLTADLAGKISAALIDAPTGVASKKTVRGSVTDYGAVLDGVADDTAAFQAAIDAIGTPYMPPGTAKITAPLLLRKSGDGLIGHSPEKSILVCSTTAFQRDGNGITGCILRDFTIEAAPSVITNAHPNSQSYANLTCVDLSGISFARVENVTTRFWQTHFSFGYSATSQTYKNLLLGTRSIGGETGIFLGGSASPRDGSNANLFIGVSTMSMSIHYRLQSALNTVVGARIENPLQTPGYPPTSIAFQFDPGFYCIKNNVFGSYVELVGTGHHNIKVPNTGSGWVSPNEFVGGAYFATAATTFEAPGTQYGFTLNALQLPYSQNVWSDTGGLVSKNRTDYGDRTMWYDNSWKTQAYVLHRGAPPTTGTFPVGAYVINTTPTAGQPIGWLCTVAGTPGTWVPMPALSPPGTTAQRPTAVDVGTPYFDTTIGKPVWVKAAPREVDTLTVTAGATSAGNVTVTLNGVAFNVAVLATDDTTTEVATKIRAATFTGWVTGGSGADVTFTKNTTGTNSAPVFSGGTTGVTGTIVVTSAGAATVWTEALGTDFSPSGSPGIVDVDSFAGANDDAKFLAALTYAAAQTRVPAVRLRHGVTTLANSYDMFTGMKVIGAGAENMAFGEEVGSGKAVISKIRFTGASGTSSLFKSSSTINYVTVANLAFHGDADCQVFHSTGNVYGAQFHNLDFYGCLSAFGNSTNKFLMTFSHFTGFWTVNAPAGTQFWLGGSDNTLWMGGQANIGGNPSTAGAGLYLAELQGLSKTNVGYAYITANNGWRGLRTSGDCSGLTLYGGVYEGQNDGDPSHGNLIRCEGTGTVRIRDPFLAYGMTSPDGTEHGIVEVACSANGQVLLDGFTYRRDNDVAETVPVAYVSGGSLRVLNGMADKQYNTWTGLPRVQNAGGTLTNDATVTVV